MSAETYAHSLKDKKLIRAVETGNVRKVKKALKSGANPNIIIKNTRVKSHYTLLSIAVGYNFKALIELFNFGAKALTDHTSNAWSQIKCFSDSSRIEILKLLLLYKANPNSQDSDGETALHWAAFINNKQFVELLLDAGAQLDIKDTVGEQPLHWHAALGNTESIELLLSYGANGNAQDIQGNTPLHYAVRIGQVGAVKALLKANVSLSVKNNHGLTPYVTACSARLGIELKKQIVNLLNEYKDYITTIKVLKKQQALSRILCNPSTVQSPNNYFQNLPVDIIQYITEYCL